MDDELLWVHELGHAHKYLALTNTDEIMIGCFEGEYKTCSKQFDCEVQPVVLANILVGAIGFEIAYARKHGFNLDLVEHHCSDDTGKLASMIKGGLISHEQLVMYFASAAFLGRLLPRITEPLSALNHRAQVF